MKIMIYLQKSETNHCKKYNIFGQLIAIETKHFLYFKNVVLFRMLLALHMACQCYLICCLHTIIYNGGKT